MPKNVWHWNADIFYPLWSVTCSIPRDVLQQFGIIFERVMRFYEKQEEFCQCFAMPLAILSTVLRQQIRHFPGRARSFELMRVASRGHDAEIDNPPHVPSHERAGTVQSIGPAVVGEWVGQRVTLTFVCGCGMRSTCFLGHQHVWDWQFQPGVQADVLSPNTVPLTLPTST